MAITYAEVNDPVSTVVSLLSSNWTAGHTDDTTPTIDESWDIGKKNLKNGDVVRVYEIAGSHEFGMVGNGLDKGNARISIDISTAASRARLRKLYSEVVSIVRGGRAGNAGTALNSDYVDVKLLSRVDQTDKLRRWYRYVVDCEITNFEVVV